MEIVCPGECLGGGLVRGDTIDIFSEPITFVHRGAFNSSTLNGLSFLDLDWVGAAGIITNVIATGAHSGISWGDDWVKLNMQGIGPAGTVAPDLEVEHVPLPTVLSLFGLGLAGLGWSRRRKA